MLSFHPFLASLLVLPAAMSFGQPASDFGFEYFNVVGNVMGEVKAIPWTGELCVESFPETKPAIESALVSWTERNREAAATLDAQFDVVQKYWSSLPARDRSGHPTRQQMVDQLSAQRPALKKRLESGDQSEFKKLCSVYAQALQSKRMDIEVCRGPQMAIIRRGPR